MTGIAPISGIALDGTGPVIDRIGLAGPQAAAGNPSADFSAILSTGLQAVDENVATADALVRQFAVDDSIPVHQVTLALEEARLSVELAMEVRTRVLETYRELMNMQV